MSNNIIVGNPTKNFFIEMITRDISIKDAIVDLLDNSIDGANRINAESYDGLFINLTINENEFIVEDNCGGFSLEVAKKYAFRFGRPDDAPETKNSVGRFGIGMKRALFKIGKEFSVESKTDDDKFKVAVDVDAWKTQITEVQSEGNLIQIDDWNFSYEEIENSNLTNNGTYICVKNLHPEVSSIFKEDAFLVGLQTDIERLLNFSLEKGLKITLNGENLRNVGINVLFDTNNTIPYFVSGSKGNVKYRVVAGLGEVGQPSLAGWYIYCNDRLVVEADQTEMTGWGTASIPHWHLNFAMFRGIVFIDSSDTIELPLTTTKKGIDATSDVYKVILGHMKNAMVSIFAELKKMTKIEDANEYRKLLGEQSDKQNVVSLKSMAIPSEKVFFVKSLDLDVIALKEDKIRIAYSISANRVNAVKSHIGARSNKDVGITTFEYYENMEEITNE